ncbi:zinc-binding alcohol dehydrogenase family protein [Maribacter sp. HTCC2170]|uniref:zinc-binding alcohol dehydrogenase family protein n=1 Tax=Maribacter sp. (strain HTCC2170 / KCCM 42371) TaxID=313603 RepID=UPI00006BD3AB|nr:zinc-binding alcohol dehydrogenase family protein [Maribacter sp. HTCC2170]EAR02287.1 Zn-dependent alcohol dehydrogenase [Maribacter sp. HTCC2170]
MKYIVCEKPGKFLLKEKKAPLGVKGHALLKINKVGICGTDLHAYAGNQAFFTYPRILGHELAAEIISIPTNQKGLKAGDKVVIMPYVSCNTCIACRNGKNNCCTNMQVLGIHTDGGMQEKINVPIELLLKANELTDDEIAIVEPLAIGAHAISRSGLSKDETAVVVGCGPIGLGIMKLAQLEGVQIIAIDNNSERLSFAKEIMGIDHTIIANNDTVNEVMKITKGDLATTVFDASGNKLALESGIHYMSHGGRYILVGLSKGNLNFVHPEIHAKESTILCSRNATLDDFKHVMTVLKKKQFPVSSFITHNVDFTNMIHNFDNWLDPATGVIKATVDF